MPTATAQPSGIPGYRWWLITGCSTLVLLLQLWLFKPIIDSYFPNLDEIAVQVASTPIGGPASPLWWLRHGFHGYFVPFPDWQTLDTNYWRPLVNAYYWGSYQIFGDHWGDQLILGYAVHALAVGLTCYLALNVLRLNLWLTAAAVVIAAFNPAYLHQDLLRDPFLIPRATQFPIYQIEVLDALLVMLGFLAFVKRRFWLFGLLVSLALLLKETALSAPGQERGCESLLVGARRGRRGRRGEYCLVGGTRARRAAGREEVAPEQHGQCSGAMGECARIRTGQPGRSAGAVERGALWLPLVCARTGGGFCRDLARARSGRDRARADVGLGRAATAFAV